MSLGSGMAKAFCFLLFVINLDIFFACISFIENKIVIRIKIVNSNAGREFRKHRETKRGKEEEEVEATM